MNKQTIEIEQDIEQDVNPATEQEAVARFAAGDEKRGLVIDCVQRGTTSTFVCRPSSTTSVSVP